MRKSKKVMGLKKRTVYNNPFYSWANLVAGTGLEPVTFGLWVWPKKSKNPYFIGVYKRNVYESVYGDL